MSTQGTIKRYTLLIEKISYGAHPSFNALKDFLEEHGFSISPRTLQRDIEQIRTEFGIEIAYNRSKNGYVLLGENGQPPASLVRFLEILGTAELLSNHLRTGDELNNYVSFEARGNLKGIENLGLLLPAIKARRKIEFEHENYESGKITKYQLQPYLLREYLNRWYVFGKVEAHGNYRTFGIDRIRSLHVKKETFRVDKNVNPKAYFEDLIGSNYSENDPEDIRFVTNPVEAKYLLALPLHSTQKIISQTKDEVVFSLTIRPNYEFKQRMLMMMDRARIIQPKWMVDEMRDILKKMLGRYKLN